jgi:Lrp/AsnC family transcriptional regulator
MDDIDRKILCLLQEDVTLSTGDIAEQVGLSTTPCWRRIQNLEKNGYIKGRVALLDRAKLNVGVDVFVSIKTSNHSWEWFEKFSNAVIDFPQVVEFYRMSGGTDYLMRVVVPDIEAFDGFYKQLIQKADLADVSSSFAMEQLKYTTALPLNYVLDKKG